jgi:dTDP-4-dehydrorhamnose 3,5-epimerase
MKIETTPLPGVLLITPARHGDERGFFSETFRASALAEAGFDKPFIQDNHSRSPRRGTVRGLHFQLPPVAQDKLIRVTRGALLDVAVDIRAGSPTYGRAFAVELSAENWRQLLIPAGFAHGFQTLTDDVEALYKVTAYYAPEHERGLRWNDPALQIEWPIPAEQSLVNARDAAWPMLDQLGPQFPPAP